MSGIKTNIVLIGKTDVSIYNLDVSGNINIDGSIYLYGVPLSFSGGGVTQIYVDGSLALRDSSIEALFIENDIQDASISDLRSRIDIIDGSLVFIDSSINQLFSQKADKSYVDSSLALRDSSLQAAFINLNALNLAVLQIDLSVNTLFLQNFSQDSSIIRIDNEQSIQDASITNLGLKISIIDGSIAFIDSSINQLFSQKSDLSYVNSTFLRESSLGPQFYFQDGSLFVIDISGMTPDVNKDYVDGSLALRDASITNNSLRIEIIDSSITFIDSSINQLFSQKADKSYVDSSLALRDASIQWLTDNTYTKTYIDGSLSLRDASISQLFVIINNFDISIGGLDILTQIHEASLGNLIASQLQQDLSINNLFQISDNLETSIGVLDSIIQIHDISIGNINAELIRIDGSLNFIFPQLSQLDASIQRIDASFGDYVRKDGDIMTGPLTATSIKTTGDLSIGGALYLGNDTSAGSGETDLLAVVTASGKIVTTSIPAGNVELGVTDVSSDIDVSVLSGIYYVDTSAGNVTLTLPVADASFDGRSFNIIKKTLDSNEVIVQVSGLAQPIGSNFIQTIVQPDKGFRLVADNDNQKYLILQDSRYLEGKTQGEFQYWDVSSRTWLPTTSDITWNNEDLMFTVGGNSTPPTFQVDASRDIVYLNSTDISGLASSDDLAFLAGGRGAFGNAVTIDRLRNNVPGNVPRALSLIDTTATLRIWRYVDNANDPAMEFVWGIGDAPSSTINAWWDMFLDGANDGTDSFAIRSRTAPFGDQKLLTVFRERTQIQSTTQSYDSSSGSLLVFGGAGISGNLNTAGAINPGGAGPNNTLFPDVSTGGSLFYRQDIQMLFNYDSSRGKWLSVGRSTLNGGRTTAVAGSTVYIRVGDATQSSTTGYRMVRNGTITGFSIENNNTLTTARDIQLRINDVSSLTRTIAVGQKGFNFDQGNVDFNSGDLIQIAALPSSAGAALNNWIALIEFATRV